MHFPTDIRKKVESDGRKTLIICTSSGNLHEIIASNVEEEEEMNSESENTNANINIRTIQQTISPSSVSMFGIVGKFFGFGGQSSAKPQANNTSEGVIKSVYTIQLSDGSKDVYVLTSSHLQKWNVSSIKDRVHFTSMITS